MIIARLSQGRGFTKFGVHTSITEKVHHFLFDGIAVKYDDRTGVDNMSRKSGSKKGMTSNNNHDSQTDIGRVMSKKCYYYHHHAQVIKWDILFWTPFGQGLESVHQIWCRYIKVLLRLGSFLIWQLHQ